MPVHPGAERRYRKREFALAEDLRLPDDGQPADGEPVADVDFVEVAMLSMDRKYKTQFYDWIRNEHNAAGMCQRFSHMIDELNDEAPPHAMIRGMKWLTAGWSAKRVAEVLIKWFFRWGIGDRRFVDMASALTEGWPISQCHDSGKSDTVVQLVVTLCVGEPAPKVAFFVRNLTETWDMCDTTGMVSLVCDRLHWDATYYRRFIEHYVALDADENKTHIHPRRMTVASVGRKFSLRQQASSLRGCAPADADVLDRDPDAIAFCDRIFEMCVLQTVTARHQDMVAAAQRNLDALLLRGGVREDVPSLESPASDLPNPVSPMDEDQSCADISPVQPLSTSDSTATSAGISNPLLTAGEAAAFMPGTALRPPQGHPPQQTSTPARRRRFSDRSARAILRSDEILRHDFELVEQNLERMIAEVSTTD